MKKLDIKNGWVVNWTIIALVALGLFAIYALSGCMTEKKINRFKELYCKDSVSIQIKERVVKIPIYYSDSSMLEVYLQCDSLSNIYYTNWKQIEGKYSDLQAKLDSNIFKVKTVFKIKDSIRYTERDTNKYQQAKIITNELTKTQEFYYNFGKWSFWIIVVVVVLALVYTFFKFKAKILGFFK